MKLLFSVTAADCDWKFMPSSVGAGGQKRQKSSTACLVTHRESGAQGYSQESRSQRENKEIAFKRMAQTKKFKTWHKMETARRLGTLSKAEEETEKAMQPHNLKVEGKNEKGLWEEI